MWFKTSAIQNFCATIYREQNKGVSYKFQFKNFVVAVSEWKKKKTLKNNVSTFA